MTVPHCANCKREWNNADICSIYTVGDCPGCGRYVSGGYLSDLWKKIEAEKVSNPGDGE